jgi:hypothetical protein
VYFLHHPLLGHGRGRGRDGVRGGRRGLHIFYVHLGNYEMFFLTFFVIILTNESVAAEF